MVQPGPLGCKDKDSEVIAVMTKALRGLLRPGNEEGRLCPRAGRGRADLGRTQGPVHRSRLDQMREL